MERSKQEKQRMEEEQRELESQLQEWRLSAEEGVLILLLFLFRTCIL